MTEEHADEHAADDRDNVDDQDNVDVQESAPAGPVRTGDPEIDALLDRVEGLDALPVEEHVVVFEQAHEHLRRALDAQPTTS